MPAQFFHCKGGRAGNSRWWLSKEVPGGLVKREWTAVDRPGKVVDTVLKTADGTIGVNTNCYAAGAALERLLAPPRPCRVLIAGTGASARSRSSVLRLALRPGLRHTGRRPHLERALAPRHR